MCWKNQHFFKELTPSSRTYELRGQWRWGGGERNVQNQDKQNLTLSYKNYLPNRHAHPQADIAIRLWGWRLIKEKKKIDCWCEKEDMFPSSQNIHFLSHTLQSERKWTRAETHGRLKQNRSSFAGYLRNAYWYIGAPPSTWSSSEQVCRCTSRHLRVKVNSKIFIFWW